MIHLNAWNLAKIDFEFKNFFFFVHINRAVFFKAYIELNKLLYRVQRPKKHTLLRQVNKFLENLSDGTRSVMSHF